MTAVNPFSMFHEERTQRSANDRLRHLGIEARPDDQLPPATRLPPVPQPPPFWAFVRRRRSRLFHGDRGQTAAKAVAINMLKAEEGTGR